ncbi:MAG: uracil-DNA glycosylase [Thermodesulfobacteriota bacterium]
MDGGPRDLSVEIESVLTALELLRGSGISHIPVPRPPRGPGAGGGGAVPGEGRTGARVMFIGSVPDHASAAAGRPFSEDGPEGELLARMMAPMGLARDEVYITYAVKTPPVGGAGGAVGAGPAPGRSRDVLAREISAVGPSVIVTLGEAAAEAVLGSRGLTALRGRFHSYGGIPVMPTHEPATLLKREALKREAWEDLKKVMKRLALRPPE